MTNMFTSLPSSLIFRRATYYVGLRRENAIVNYVFINICLFIGKIITAGTYVLRSWYVTISKEAKYEHSCNYVIILI